MKKTKMAMLISALAMASSAMAGTMGMESVAADQHALYGSVDALYAWNSIDSSSINNVAFNKSNNGWGGRAALGAMHHTSTPLTYTAEAGWGYYGQTKFNNTALGVSNNVDLYGFDVLVGAMYRINQFDIFGKVGGLVENTRISRNIANQAAISGNSFQGSTSVVRTFGTVLPEINVGGIYNVNDQWGLSVSYLYAFGNDNVDMHMTSSASSVDGNFTLAQTTSATTAPVSLSTIMFGLRYNFA